jgi:hypothetical protein
VRLSSLNSCLQWSLVILDLFELGNLSGYLVNSRRLHLMKFQCSIVFLWKVVLPEYNIIFLPFMVWIIFQNLFFWLLCYYWSVFHMWSSLLAQKTGLLDIKANTAVNNGRCYRWLAFEANLLASEGGHYCFWDSMGARCKNWTNFLFLH